MCFRETGKFSTLQESALFRGDKSRSSPWYGGPGRGVGVWGEGIASRGHIKALFLEALPCGDHLQPTHN